MYTVLLVDDEKSVVEFLKSSLPWANLGVETVLTAYDGVQATELLKIAHVDLLITDIRMPRMDGLTLLRQLKQTHPDIHTILLTAYGEFEYAREALLLGADNYLLKPIRTQELTETIENTLDNIYIMRHAQSTLFQENILRRWITGCISTDELSERAVHTDINIYQPYYCIVAMRKLEEDFQIQEFARTCISRFPADWESSAVWDNTGHYILLIGSQRFDRKALAAFWEGCSHPSLSIAVGCVVADRMDIHNSYQNACRQLDSQEAPSVSYSPAVERAIKYIEKQYAEGISIKEFCNSLNMNASYLGYLFKKETGVYFNTYATNFRMEKAKELLCSTNENVNDIAEKIGFATASYFITLFKKETGLSPLKFREIHSRKEFT